jgi:hypothetical protein
MFHFVLEVIALTGSLGYYIIRSFISQTPLLPHSDDCIKEIQFTYLSQSFLICFVTYVIGEFILMYLIDNFIIVGLYVTIWFIPASIYTFLGIKKGLMVWGTKKAEKTGLRAFKKRVFVGSIFFGIVVGRDFVFNNGVFKPIGILWILGLSVGWGIPFYLIMKALINKSELNSDNELKKAEDDH